jgi:hypothetical protein
MTRRDRVRIVEGDRVRRHQFLIGEAAIRSIAPTDRTGWVQQA